MLEAGEAGLKSVIGAKLGTEPEQFAQSQIHHCVGAPTFTATTFICGRSSRKPAAMARSWWSSIHIAHALRSCADWYMPINPGTDVALALGHDARHHQRKPPRCRLRRAAHDGFEQLRDKVQEYPPENALRKWTGIARQTTSRS